MNAWHPICIPESFTLFHVISDARAGIKKTLHFEISDIVDVHQ
jgi:hypothetical protein